MISFTILWIGHELGVKSRNSPPMGNNIKVFLFHKNAEKEKNSYSLDKTCMSYVQDASSLEKTDIVLTRTIPF